MAPNSCYFTAMAGQLIVSGAIRAMVILAVSATHVGCVSASPPPACVVEDDLNKHLSGTHADICDRLVAQIAEALNSRGWRGDLDALAFELAVGKPGTLGLQITQEDRGGPASYPFVAVEVWDRDLSDKDLNRLAQAAAELIVNEFPLP